MLISAIAPGVLACSHFFDNNVFPLDDAGVLRAPVADFRGELERLGMRKRQADAGRGTQKEADDREAAQFEADVAELAKALGMAEGPAKAKILGDYRAIRKATRDRLAALAAEREVTALGSVRGPGPKPVPMVTAAIPDGLPAEFDDYVRGAVAYANGETDEAVEWWERLLLLPAERRKYRSVWAAYMVGRARAEDEETAEAAIAALRKARELAKAGFADSQNLAAASLGWAARAELARENFERAIELYFEAGDADSLSIAAHRAFDAGPEVMGRLARHKLSAGVMLAVILAKGGPWRAEIEKEKAGQFLAALERAGAVNVGNADRVAWAAYQRGDAAGAARWLGAADQRSLVARWLATKLMLREGKVGEASAGLAELVREWPVNDEWNGHWEDPLFPQHRIVGEWAMLALARGQYVDSMHLLLSQGYFAEAAYVAERVLTADELKAYVDGHWPAPSNVLAGAREAKWYERVHGQKPAEVAQSIRYLLARRLTRLKRYDEAMGYFPDNWRATLTEYVTALGDAEDRTLSRDERGERLWEAAKIARRWGMEIMGTEGGPDDRSSDGSFGWDGTIDGRSKPGLANPLTRATDDERRRALAHHPEPDRRFHYRYIAAEHGWRAAQMLPDESDLKARVLCTAGNWVGKKDPAAGQRFYRSLVHDCGTTKLGRAARKAGWLPVTPAGE